MVMVMVMAMALIAHGCGFCFAFPRHLFFIFFVAISRSQIFCRGFFDGLRTDSRLTSTDTGEKMTELEMTTDDDDARENERRTTMEN
jgi:hypothetical protein